MKNKQIRIPGFMPIVASLVVLNFAFSRADELPAPVTHELDLAGVKAALSSITNSMHQIAPGAEMRWNDNVALQTE